MDTPFCMMAAIKDALRLTVGSNIDDTRLNINSRRKETNPCASLRVFQMNSTVKQAHLL